jgi:UDP-3-O-[3-hydroxymyristoyl] glucosamine N-acyltransferase
VAWFPPPSKSVLPIPPRFRYPSQLIRPPRDEEHALSLTVQQLAKLVDGEVDGDPNLVLQRPASIDDAEPGDFTFVAPGERNTKTWWHSKASTAFVCRDFPPDTRPLIRIADPQAAFIRAVLQLRGDRENSPGRHPTAAIHPTVQLGENAFVGPHVSIGAGSVIGPNAVLHAGAVIGRHCTLGSNVTLHPNVVVYDDCILGHRVIIHANAVIGADGFGYRLVKGRHEKILQVGTAEIGDDVEIGACTTVDRGAVGATRIGSGTKIDNHVMVAHNVRIGKHNILVAQVGLAGSSSTGQYVVLAGQVGVADHVHIGDQAQIGGQGGVIGDVPPGAELLGTPAVPRRDFYRGILGVQKLGELRDEVKALKAQVKALEERT